MVHVGIPPDPWKGVAEATDPGCYSEWVKSSSETSGVETQPGLCGDCVHARRIESDRGSVFFLCQLALTDGRFKKYPRLPVLSCIGYKGTESTV